MDLTQLEYFKSVAKWENITKASKELYVSQPTLSQSISRLEDGLGVDLFDRRAGKLHLNDAGRLFLSRVNNAFAELNTGFSELEQYKKNGRPGFTSPPLSLTSSSPSFWSTMPECPRFILTTR